MVHCMAAVALLCVLLALAAGPAAGAREDPFVGYQEKAAPEEHITLRTNFGPIRIKLFSSAAPQTTRQVLQLAQQGCSGCHFYRNEAKPWQGNGPPYSLLQGVLELPAIPPPENQIPVKMGHLCMIPGTKDFFIAYGDHPEWGSSHTVFGEMAGDWLAVDLIISQDYNKVKHPEHGTEMRMLKQEVKFTITADAPAAAQQ